MEARSPALEKDLPAGVSPMSTGARTDRRAQRAGGRGGGTDRGCSSRSRPPGAVSPSTTSTASRVFTGASRRHCGTPTPPTSTTLGARADRRSPGGVSVSARTAARRRADLVTGVSRGGPYEAGTSRSPALAWPGPSGLSGELRPEGPVRLGAGPRHRWAVELAAREGLGVDPDRQGSARIAAGTSRWEERTTIRSTTRPVRPPGRRATRDRQVREQSG